MIRASGLLDMSAPARDMPQRQQSAGLTRWPLLLLEKPRRALIGAARSVQLSALPFHMPQRQCGVGLQQRLLGLLRETNRLVVTGSRLLERPILAQRLAQCAAALGQFGDIMHLPEERFCLEQSVGCHLNAPLAQSQDATL